MNVLGDVGFKVPRKIAGKAKGSKECKYCYYGSNMVRILLSPCFHFGIGRDIRIIVSILISNILSIAHLDL